MASRIAEAYVQIVPRIDGVAKGISQQLSGPMGAAGAAGGTSFAGGFKKLAGPAIVAGVALGSVAIAKFGKDAIAAGEASATANARIGNIASSMNIFGDNAGAVSARLIDLARDQAIATGVDQNAIKATQAKLLTFKELASSADDLGGNFDRATSAAVDLAAAGFGSAESNAVQLGKALNDPVKGIAALNRSGVTFTEVEKEKIKALVESGEILEAQNLVLQAIETQVGGTAIATSNSSDRIKVAFSQVKESIGKVLLPAFDAANDGIINKLLIPLRNGIERLPEIFESIQSALAPFVEGFKKAFELAGGGVQGFIAAIMDVRQRLADAFITALPGIIEAIVGFIPVIVENTVNIILAIVDAIVQALPSLIQGAVTLFNGLIDGLLRIVPVLISAIVQMIPVVISALVSALPKIIQGAITLFLGIVTGLLNALPQIISALVNAIPQIITALANALPLIINGAIQLFLGITTGLIQALPQIIVALIKAMPELIKAIINAVPLFVQAGFDLIGGLIKGIANAIPQLLGAISKGIGDAINAAKKALGINSPSRVFMEIGGNAMEGFSEGIESMAKVSVRAMTAATSKVIQAGQMPTAMQNPASSPIRELEGNIQGSAKKDRPIYADGMGLIGWIREVANGEAKLVFNTELNRVTRGVR
jgi:phage-related protein